MTPLQPTETDAADGIASVGMAAVQLIFDECMARFAVLLELWNRESCAILDGESSSAESSRPDPHTVTDVYAAAQAA